MQMLGERLCQPVRQRLHHDAAVVVGGLEMLRQRRLFADPRRHCKRADVIGQPGFDRRDEIGQRRVRPFAPVRPFVLTRDLLAQRMCAREFGLPRRILVEHDVVANAVRRPEADHRVRRQPTLADHPRQQLLGVAEKFGRFDAYHLVLQDHRVSPGQFPRREERRPIDHVNQFSKIVVLERTCTGECRRFRHASRPIDLKPVRARLRQRQPHLLLLALQVVLADLDVLGGNAGHVRLGLRRRQQVRHHAHRAARVGHIDRLPVPVVWRDFHSGVYSACRCAADQQRHAEI